MRLTIGSSNPLLRRQGWELLDHRDRRRIPLSDQDLLLGRVYAHGEVEQGLRRRKPVRLLARSGVRVLDVEVKRTIRIVLERHPTADGEAVDAVRDLVAIRP